MQIMMKTKETRFETLMTVPVTKEYESYPTPILHPQGEGVRGRVKGIFR